MSPGAKDTATGIAAEALVPEKLLNQGEVVILAMKPSVWYVVLTAWPGVVLAVALTAGAYFAEHTLGMNMPPRMVMVLAVAAVVGQFFIGSCQWVGRLYVLTNVRVLRIRGIFRVELFQCPLKSVHEVHLTATTAERALSVGSLHFKTPSTAAEQGWMYVARPAEVYEIVQDAIKRAHNAK